MDIVWENAPRWFKPRRHAFGYTPTPDRMLPAKTLEEALEVRASNESRINAERLRNWRERMRWIDD